MDLKNTILLKDEQEVFKALVEKSKTVNPVYYFNSSTIGNFMGWMEEKEDESYLYVLCKVINWAERHEDDETSKTTNMLLELNDTIRGDFKQSIDSDIYKALVTDKLGVEEASTLQLNIMKLWALIAFNTDMAELLQN